MCRSWAVVRLVVSTDYSSRLRSRTENNLTHIFLVLVTVGLGHGVYRKLYTLIGGQRAEKFENHSSRHISLIQ